MGVRETLQQLDHVKLSPNANTPFLESKMEMETKSNKQVRTRQQKLKYLPT